MPAVQHAPTPEKVVDGGQRFDIAIPEGLEDRLGPEEAQVALGLQPAAHIQDQVLTGGVGALGGVGDRPGRSDQATRSSRWQCECRTPAVETVARLTPKSRATYFCEHRLRTASTMAWRWGGFPVGLLIVGSSSENAFTATPGAFRRLWHLAAEGIPPYHSPIKALRYRDIAIVFIAITLQRTFRNSLPPQQKRRDIML